MGVYTLIKVVGALMFAISALFIILAFNIEATDVATGIEGVQPGPPIMQTSRRRRHSPAPATKPLQRPSMVDWLGDEYNLRQCQCRKDWKSQPEGASLCRCNKNCPAYVTPAYLTEAKGQSLCSLEEHTGYNCYAECFEDSADPQDFVKWYAIPCGEANQPACQPSTLAYRAEARAEQLRRAEKDKQQAEKEKAEAAYPKVTWDVKEVYDLRGLLCEEKEGKEQCYMEDEQGRELCPRSVTHEYLGFPQDQYLCSEAMVDKYYCTVSCSSDGAEVRWGAHEISWCYDPKNVGSCPPRPTPVPKAEFTLKPWSEKPEVELECARKYREGERPKKVPNLTIGLLTHEANAFAVSMKTYEELGMFDVVDEFLIFMNRRRPEVEAVAEEYRKKHPEKIRLLGDSVNHGILRAMVWLTGNATNEYFMFLERDFALIEPSTCVAEQFQVGIDLVKKGTAHVVRYRHKRHAGRPNWAARMFRGHEDDVFKNGQPNLFCNHHYWYEEPEKRWPDKIWICNTDPVMWCSDSFYCNWTNNPQLWYLPWWNKEYVQNFDKFERNDPWYDIEVYMNWEPNSWNDRKWIVAQGDGLFKHGDRFKWG